MAGQGQVPGHGVTHHPEAQESDFAAGNGFVRAWVGAGHGVAREVKKTPALRTDSKGRRRVGGGRAAAQGVQTMAKCSVPEARSGDLARWLLSLICRRRSFSESALRRASS